jgi:hypothetical protein
MDKFREIIMNNQSELAEVVIDFVEKKMKEKKKSNKSPKTVCHFKVLGKKYESDIFVDNYSKFLVDLSKIHSYELFKTNLGTFIKSNQNEFSDVTLNKVKPIELKCGGYVSTYSSTQRKIVHLKNICDNIGVNIDFDYRN